MSALTDKIAKVIGEKIFTANIDKNDLSELIKEIAVIAEAGGGGLVIPLSGTTEGNPVTGDIEFDNSLGRRLSGNTAGAYIEYTADGKIVMNDESSGEVIASGIIIKGNSPVEFGINGTYDYSPNINDLDYTQKIYVDGLRGKHISKTTTEINGLSSVQDGETYFNTTLNKLCFFNGTIWQQVTSSAM